MNKLGTLALTVMAALGVAQGCNNGKNETTPTSPKIPSAEGNTPITSHHYETVPTYVFPNHWTQKSNAEQGVKACHDGIAGNPDNDDRLVFDTGNNEITALTADINGQGTWSFYLVGKNLRHFVGTLYTVEEVKARSATPEEVMQVTGQDANALIDKHAVVPGDLGGDVVFNKGQYSMRELPDSVCDGVEQTKSPACIPAAACGPFPLESDGTNCLRDQDGNPMTSDSVIFKPLCI